MESASNPPRGHVSGLAALVGNQQAVVRSAAVFLFCECWYYCCRESYIFIRMVQRHGTCLGWKLGPQ